MDIEVVESDVKRFALKLTKDDAQAIYAALDFPSHAVQPRAYVAVWQQLAEALDNAFGWQLEPAAHSGMTDNTTIE